MYSPEISRRNRRLAWRLALFVLLMFGFAWFVMPPLYDLACRAFGLNGKSFSGAPSVVSATDTTRDVTVEFLANVYRGTPLEFRAPRTAYRRRVRRPQPYRSAAVGAGGA